MGISRAALCLLVPCPGTAPGRHRRSARVLLATLAVGSACYGCQVPDAFARSATAPPAASAASQDRAYARHEAAIAYLRHAECDPAGPNAQDSMLAAAVQGELTAELSGGLSAEQASCAREIYQNTISDGYDAHAAVIEICAAITETNLFNDAGGDGTSVGLFQMIDALGTVAERENVPYETSWFLNRMSSLYPEGSWEWEPVGNVDQEVEVSAYPDRYQPNAGDAQTIVSALTSLQDADLRGHGG